MYHGLQLQLIVYLNAALELEEKNHPGKHAEPAGMFYYHVKDPLVDGKPGDEEEEIERKLLEKLKVDGLVRAEEKILKDLDRELEAGKKSLVIPAAYNKNGSLSSRSKTAAKNSSKNSVPMSTIRSVKMEHGSLAGRWRKIHIN